MTTDPEDPISPTDHVEDNTNKNLTIRNIIMMQKMNSYRSLERKSMSAY